MSAATGKSATSDRPAQEAPRGPRESDAVLRELESIRREIRGIRDGIPIMWADEARDLAPPPAADAGQGPQAG